MSFTTGIELSGHRKTKAEALRKVYIIKAKRNSTGALTGVCAFPQVLVGLRVKLKEVKPCQTDK